MATRVGKYVWDIDLESMCKEELMALEQAAHYFRTVGLARKYAAELRELIVRAAKDDISLICDNPVLLCDAVSAVYDGDEDEKEDA